MGSWYREKTALEAAIMFSRGKARSRAKTWWEGIAVVVVMESLLLEKILAARRNSRHWDSVLGWQGERVALAVGPPDSMMAAWKGAVAGSV